MSSNEERAAWLELSKLADQHGLSWVDISRMVNTIADAGRPTAGGAEPVARDPFDAKAKTPYEMGFADGFAKARVVPPGGSLSDEMRTHLIVLAREEGWTWAERMTIGKLIVRLGEKS